jgi:heptosyltransferase-1
MSSLGDVIHALPAVTDAIDNNPSITFDWVVEESFAAIPALHPGVDRVIPIGLRRWRSAFYRSTSETLAFVRDLRRDRYDLVIDAQGLIKSAVVSKLARGNTAGFDRASAREPFSALAYGQRLKVAKEQHAIDRIRQLFAGALGYEVPDHLPRYGLGVPKGNRVDRVMLLHGTTWNSKHWPVECWVELADRLLAQGYEVVLTHGNAVEEARAGYIASRADGAQVLPRAGLPELAGQLTTCRAVVTVDSGLGHLAVALGLPVVGLYGPTNATMTGLAGDNVLTLATKPLACTPCLRRECQFRPVPNAKSIFPPCFQEITADRVMQVLFELTDGSECPVL